MIGKKDYWNENDFYPSSSVTGRLPETPHSWIPIIDGYNIKVYYTAKIVNTGKDPFVFRSNIIIGDFVFIALKDLTMHQGSQIAPHAILSGGGIVRMHKNSVIGFGAHLITGTDTPKGKYMCEAAEPEDRHIIRGTIILKKGAYIASQAMICVTEEHPEITIGENSVIGAFSYIDRSIPDNVIVHPEQKLVYNDR